MMSSSGSTGRLTGEWQKPFAIDQLEVQMRKIVAGAILAAVAIMAVAVASASASDKFKGTCKIQGKAVFGKGLLLGTPQKTTYTFAKGKVKAVNVKAEAECEGEATKSIGGEKEFGTFAGAEKWEVKTAEVFGPGKGNLECGVLSEDEKAAGTTAKIVLKRGKEFTAEATFEFKSTGVPGEIEAKLTAGTDTASGFANFTEPGNAPEKKEVVEKCAIGGAAELPFETASEGPAPTVGITGTIG